MVRNNSYFYISGFISLSLFTFFVSIVIFMMVSAPKDNLFALKKDQFISISIETPKVKVSPKKSLVTPTKQESSEVVKDVSIDDLFSDVWTKKIKKVKKKKKIINKRRLEEIAKKSKILEKKTQQELQKQKDNFKSAMESDESKKDSTANVVNEYLAKIQALVYENFVPPQNSQGNSVKAVIELSSIGKVMDFRILTYSASSSLNEECDKIKDRLRGVLFPTNPQNRSGSYIIILTSKE